MLSAAAYERFALLRTSELNILSCEPIQNSLRRQLMWRRVDLSVNDQRMQLLRYALQNSKTMKYVSWPDFTVDEQNKLLSSLKQYIDFFSLNTEINHFSELQVKYPFIFESYFRDIPSYPRNTTAEVWEDIPLNKANFYRHLTLSKAVIVNCTEKLAHGDVENIEDSLRRLGAIHAETWVCSKDVMLFEDSFLWSLDRCEPKVNIKEKALWRKIIRFIIFNISSGINNHYSKINYVLYQNGSRFCCCDAKLPQGADPLCQDSLKKMAAFMKAQAND